MIKGGVFLLKNVKGMDFNVIIQAIFSKVEQLSHDLREKTGLLSIRLRLQQADNSRRNTSGSSEDILEVPLFNSAQNLVQ